MIISLWLAVGVQAQSQFEQSLEKAQAGNAKAQFNVGSAYRYGKGVEKNDEQAVYWFRLSAAQNDPSGECALASCYYKGEGVMQSYEAAFALYHKAAEQGHKYAQYNIALCYLYGRGVEMNRNAARRWLTASAKVGFEKSKIALEKHFPIRVEETETGLLLVVNEAVYPLIKVEGGSFMMGATEEQGNQTYQSEKPVHEVSLSDYYIGQFELTQEIWSGLKDFNPSTNKGARLPVENVSWNECYDFIHMLNQQTGYTFSLPTEAQWEFAARGGNKSEHFRFAGSNEPDSVAWFSTRTGTHEVGLKQANELGLYDMSGNVSEWCFDNFANYTNESLSNPAGPSVGAYRVTRGGSVSHPAKGCRVSYRSNSYSPSNRNHTLGFRLVVK